MNNISILLILTRAYVKSCTKIIANNYFYQLSIWYIFPFQTSVSLNSLCFIDVVVVVVVRFFVRSIVRLLLFFFFVHWKWQWPSCFDCANNIFDYLLLPILWLFSLYPFLLLPSLKTSEMIVSKIFWCAHGKWTAAAVEHVKLFLFD